MWHYKTTYKHNINYCLKTDLIFTVEFGDQLIFINYLPFHSNESPKYNECSEIETHRFFSFLTNIFYWNLAYTLTTHTKIELNI